jgi:hypothetical protein
MESAARRRLLAKHPRMPSHGRSSGTHGCNGRNHVPVPLHKGKERRGLGISCPSRDRCQPNLCGAEFPLETGLGKRDEEQPYASLTFSYQLAPCPITVDLVGKYLKPSRAAARKINHCSRGANTTSALTTGAIEKWTPRIKATLSQH